MPLNAACDAGNIREQDKAIETNSFVNVSQVSVKKQASYQNAEDEAEGKDMQVGASAEGASSVPTKDGLEGRKDTPISDKDDSAPLQADDENRERRERNHRAPTV